MTPKTEFGERVVSVREAARLLGVTPRTVRRYAEQGILEAWQYVPGGSWRIPVASLGLSDMSDFSDVSE